MAGELKVVPVVVDNPDAPIWIELPPNDPAVRAGEWDFVAADEEKAEKDRPKALDEAIQRIRPLVDKLFENLSHVAKPPKEIELNLGLKLSGTVGIFVAQSSGEATFSIKLKWAP